MIDIFKYSYEEVKTIAAETKYFISLHLNVYEKAIEKMICQENIKDDFIKSYQTCIFNRYLKKNLEEEKNNSEIKLLIKYHANFHKLIIKILKKSKNNKKITIIEFQKLSHSHVEFVNLLNSFSHSLEFIKYQYDTLTSAWNREIFMDLLNKEHSKASRNNITFSLVFLDIDHFKKINDIYGHEAGDFVLVKLVALIQKEIRLHDTISRWGGEEFLILLNQSNLKNSYQIINRIKDKIQKKVFLYKNKKIKITCSFGIREFNTETNIVSMINKADELMYKSKKNGRNKISI